MAGEIFSRNIGTLTENEQEKLAGATIGVVGLGGTGAPAFEALARLGAGNFVIFDQDRFERTNFNRQIYAMEDSIGRWKVDVAAEKAGAINPKIRIKKYRQKLDMKSVSRLRGCGVVVDGTDNIATRGIIAKFCRAKKIPYVFCSAGGAGGMVSVFEGADFEKAFGTAKEAKRKAVLAPAAILAGTLAASQAMNAILGKRRVKAPEFLFFDLFSERVLWKQKV